MTDGPTSVKPPAAQIVSGAAAAKVAQDLSVSPGPEDEAINDDERKRFNWHSRYPKEAWVYISAESVYVLIVFLLSALGILLTWRGDVAEALTAGCMQCQQNVLTTYSYLTFSGVLGGSLFGLKYLYKVVARGWWNSDRALWRLFSPLLSGGMAFAVGALADAGLFGFATSNDSGAAPFVALGFIAGYFADSASRKLQEIADTLFGHPRPK